MLIGWLKLHRKIWSNPRSTDPEWVAVWLYILVHAAYEPTDELFKGERITLQPGQLVTSQRELSKKTGVNLSKVNRVIKVLESETQLKQETSNVSSLISILNWEKYQGGETQIETPVKHKRNASETPPILDIGIKKERSIEDNTPIVPIPNHKLQDWIIQNCPFVIKLSIPLTHEQADTILEKYSWDFAIEVLSEMDNHKDLTKKYNSVYRTFLKWAGIRQRNGIAEKPKAGFRLGEKQYQGA